MAVSGDRFVHVDPKTSLTSAMTKNLGWEGGGLGGVRGE